MRTCIGIDYVCGSTRWDDVMKGPPAEVSRAHVRKLLSFRDRPSPAEPAERPSGAGLVYETGATSAPTPIDVAA